MMILKNAFIIQLTEVLQRYQDAQLDGFVIAKIEVCPQAIMPTGLSWRRLGKQQMAIINDQLPHCQQFVSVWLLKPSVSTKGELMQTENPNPLSKIFTMAEVQSFALWSGDTNSIHTGENAVVQGLLLLSYLETNGYIPNTGFVVRFVEKVWIGEEVFILHSKKGIELQKKDGTTAVVLTAM
jgi:hypothetical protein